MGLDDLVGCIELLKARIRAHETALRENETRTRMALIDPLLHALGWNIADPGVVTPEYKVSGGRADYALLRPDGKPAATIESKKLGTVLDAHRMQMLNYANASGIEYAGLTDGNNWELYTVFQPGPLEERRVLEVSIAVAPAHASALKLLLLWRPNLMSGEPVPVNKPILTVGEVVKIPPKPPGGRRRTSKFSGHTLVAIYKDAEGNLVNPRREDTWGWRSYNIILNAPDHRISYEDYKDAGGRNNDLQWDIDRNWCAVPGLYDDEPPAN